MDKKVETVLGDPLSQLALNGDSWDVGLSMYKPGESWEHGGLISPLNLTSEKERRLLKGKGSIFRALSGALVGRDPNFSHLLLPGHALNKELSRTDSKALGKEVWSLGQHKHPVESGENMMYFLQSSSEPPHLQR